MPAGCRRWTLYNLSVVLCALKCAFTMVRKPGIVVEYDYPKFDKEAHCSAEMPAGKLEKWAWLLGLPWSALGATSPRLCYFQAGRDAALAA